MADGDTELPLHSGPDLVVQRSVGRCTLQNSASRGETDVVDGGRGLDTLSWQPGLESHGKP